MKVTAFTNIFMQALAIALIVAVSHSASGDNYGGGTLYRYINDEGVRVLGHSIPPEYAQKGYEIVNTQGHILKTVKPRLKDSDLAEQRRLEKLADWDEDLLRRYSTVADVEAAKSRRLAEIETSIAILRGNILSMDSQIAREQAKAAARERRGQEVPEFILVTIKNIKAERDAAERLKSTRQQEYDQVSARFDKDIDRFKVIQERLSRRP